MNSVVKFLFITLILVGSVGAFAQIDSINAIDTVVFEEIAALPFGKQTATLFTSDQNPQQTRSSLIAEGIYLRSHGPSGIGSISIRGGSPSHTAISWNGANIINPMLSQNDATIIPFHLFRSFLLYKGSESGIAGSGAVAGGIDLRDAFGNKKASSNASIQLASFGGRHASVYLNTGTAPINVQISADTWHADNDFIYELAPGFERKNQHGKATIQNLKVNLGHQPNARLQNGLRMWRTNAFREIPPTNQQSSSLASLADNAWRWQVFNTWSTGRFINHAQLTYIEDQNIYKDPAILEIGDNRFKKLIIENRSKYYLRNTSVYAHLLFENDEAKSKSYTSFITQQSGTIVVGTNHQLGSFLLDLYGRQAMIKDYGLLPFIPNASLGYAKKAFSAQLRLQRAYRFPGLNERFWVPGGDNKLLPESGWAQDMSFAYRTNETNIKVSLYSRKISNMIQWIPNERYISYASNIAKVWSRGLELTFEQDVINNKNHHLSTKAGVQLNKSTNEIGLSFPKIEKGSQLFYTPKWQMNGQLAYKINAFGTSLRYFYFGKTNGINANLDAYQLVDLNMNYTFKKMRNLVIDFDIFNLAEEQYFTIERRPMAGRSFSLTLRFCPEL